MEKEPDKAAEPIKEKEVEVRDLAPRIKEIRELTELTALDARAPKDELDNELDSIAEELERIKKISDRSLFELMDSQGNRGENDPFYPQREVSPGERVSYSEGVGGDTKRKYSSVEEKDKE